MVADAASEHVRLTVMRECASECIENALSASLSEESFLAAFPTMDTSALKDTLLRIREQLVELLRRGSDAAVTTWAQKYDMACVFEALDDAAIVSAAGTLLSGSEYSSQGALPQPDVAPDAQHRAARIAAKGAELERLQVLVETREASARQLREELSGLAEHARRARDEIANKAASVSAANASLRMR